VTRQPEIQIADDRVVVRQGGQTLITARLSDVVQELTRCAQRAPSCGVLPRDIRVWCERGDAVGVVIEVPPHARTVRWLTDASRAAFGPRAQYQQYFISFPYVELLIVFRRGALTGLQQLYYRREPLDAGEDLLLPNLYNVAQGYGQRCWVCLANLADVSGLSWADKIRAVVDHVFTASFNRSSEMHEGNSYFGTTCGIDPRVASLDAWQEATRENPRFALDVQWRTAGTTMSAELAMMLDRTVEPLAVRSTTDLAGVITRAGSRGRRA
jgi:hypothetical protein